MVFGFSCITARNTSSTMELSFSFDMPMISLTAVRTTQVIGFDSRSFIGEKRRDHIVADKIKGFSVDLARIQS